MNEFSERSVEMAACPHCRTQYEPVPNQRFCAECSKPLGDPSSPSELLHTPGDALNSPDPPPPPAAAIGSAPEPPAERPSRGSRTNVVGEHNITGDRVTVIQYSGNEGAADRYCAVCHESMRQNDQAYRCPECDRSPVCVEHFMPDRSRCSECVKQSDQLISTLNDPDIVIDPMGQVVEKSKVKTVGDALVSNTGERVATIKPNIWYAPAKQWYEIKPRLLSRERQAVTSMYPGLELGKTTRGSLFWSGTLTTRTGRAYDVRIQYPPNFPYIPPRAYVVNPKIKESRHIYKDGHLCLFHKDDKVWQNQTTAATVVSWTALWLHCYEVWLETGEWPRPERDQVVVQTAY